MLERCSLLDFLQIVMTLARLLAMGFIFEGTAESYVKYGVYRANDQPSGTCEPGHQVFKGEGDCEKSCLRWHGWNRRSRRRVGFGRYRPCDSWCECYPGTLKAPNILGRTLCRVDDRLVNSTSLCEGVDGSFQMSMSPINAIAMLLLAAPP